MTSDNKSTEKDNKGKIQSSLQRPILILKLEAFFQKKKKGQVGST